MIHYPISISETKAFNDFNFEGVNNCINNSKLILSLPMYPELTEKEILYVCKKINNFYLENNLLKIKNINTNGKTGILHCLNSIEFDIQRMFFIDDMETNNIRGLHANLNVDEVIIVLSGSIHVKTITKDRHETEKVFHKNEVCYIKRQLWLEFQALDKNTLILVLANEKFSKSFSEYNFDKFIS